MMLYTTLQEFATSLNYRGLRKVAGAANDPALDRVLVLLGATRPGTSSSSRTACSCS